MLQNSLRTNKKALPYDSLCLRPSGEAFSDGTLLELASNASSADRLGLLYWDGRRAKAQSRFELAGRTYVPVSVKASTLQAIRFPNRTKEYSSTGLLFRKLVDVVLKRYSGLSRPRSESRRSLGAEFMVPRRAARWPRPS